MRILVGTLYSGEKEFDDCLASIQKQTYKNFEHLIIRDLANSEAHTRLFNSFLESKDQFTLLIKVDADMVISSDTLFGDIVDKMTQFPNLDVFSIAVIDFFSGQLINGLNTYRNTVTWDYENETMFVDIPVVSPERTNYDQTVLAPAAVHCKNPSKFQAFHYGVHRGLKSIAQQHSTSHWALLEKTWRNFLRTQDVRIGLAILGAELVYAGLVSKEDVDYTNPRLLSLLEKYKSLDAQTIKREITKLRYKHWGFLPGDLRRRLIRSKYKSW